MLKIYTVALDDNYEDNFNRMMGNVDEIRYASKFPESWVALRHPMQQFDWAKRIAFEFDNKPKSSFPSSTLVTLSEFVFNGFRVAIKTGMVDHSDVLLIVYHSDGRKTEITFNKYGKPSEWVKGAFDTYGKILDELV